ncbi:hypothetical protein V8E51_005950 [Hyaloscypha variabilis]
MRLPSLVAVAALFFAATSLTAPTPGPGSDIARREAESHAVIEANSVKTKRTQHSFFQHSIGTKTGLGDDDEGYGDAARIVERDDEGYGDGARIVERALYPKVSTTKSPESIILTFQQALSDAGRKQDRVWGLTCWFLNRRQ